MSEIIATERLNWLKHQSPDWVAMNAVGELLTALDRALALEREWKRYERDFREGWIYKPNALFETKDGLQALAMLPDMEAGKRPPDAIKRLVRDEKPFQYAEEALKEVTIATRLYVLRDFVRFEGKPRARYVET